MTLTQLLTRTVTIERRGPSGVDDYGNPVQVVTSSATVLGYVEQTAADENTNDRHVASESALLVVLAGTELDAGDTVVVDGTRWQVAGPPWSVRRPGPNVEHHVEALLRRAD